MYTKPFFRKYTSDDELMIANILKPHPNIVDIYFIGDDYLDMELVGDSPLRINDRVIEDMSRAKDHLQSLGIFYLDWKLDNIGSVDSGYKLYDFDCSGVSITYKDLWEIEPILSWRYCHALSNGKVAPKDADDWNFSNFIMDA